MLATGTPFVTLPAGDGQRAPSGLRLVTLGGLALVRESGDELPLVGHKQKLALLGVLAVSAGHISRDELVAMFWPTEKNGKAARHSLSNALSFLRGIIGSGAITMHRAQIELVPDAITVDAVELLAAAQVRDFARVIDLYGGPFMDGAVVSGSPSFESWVAGQRDAMTRAVLNACDIRCTATAALRQWKECADTARRWLDVDLHSTTAALHLLNSTRATGTPDARTAALLEYDRLVERLARDGSAVPDPKVTELAHRIQSRVATAQILEKESQPSIDTHVDTAVVVTAPPKRPQSSVHAAVRRWRVPVWAIGAVAVTAIVAAGAVYFMRNESAPHRARPLIAITDIANVRGDTASAWLEDGLPQMISGDLTRSSDVEMITPVRVRATRARARIPVHGTLSSDEARELGRRLGASMIVRGGFTHGNGVYVLDISARDVVTGRAVGSFTVSGADPMTVAGWAAGRLLDLSGFGSDKPRFADVETSSIAAYQRLVHALEASSEGHFDVAKRELDEAIAIDSGFAIALAERSEIASSEGDTATIERLHRAMQHARLTPWDVAIQAIDSAESGGENPTAIRLARSLVARYPHDPRAYARLASVYTMQGSWDLASATARHALALDSLANEAGDGPCAPCTAYATLIDIEISDGKLDDAQRAARRWLALQPDLPVAWAVLGDALVYAGSSDAALDAYKRAELLSGHDVGYQFRTARGMLAARKLSVVDSIMAQMRPADRSTLSSIADLRMLMLRERGDWRGANAIAASRLAVDPGDLAFALEKLDALGRMGRYAEAARLFDGTIAALATSPDKIASSSARGEAARLFCWTRALEANALAGSGDTLRLRALADSIGTIGRWSYFARDTRLHHHVLGLIAMQGKRYAEAVREFQAARWGVSGWTETEAWLARAQLAQHDPVAAVATLRDAYEGPLDAMGRYEPHSELDSLMSVAFRDAGMPDSASVYARYVAEVRRGS